MAVIQCCSLLAFALTGCAREPVREQMLTGSAAAVAGFPRHQAPGRFEVAQCCTFQLDRKARIERPQGIDSAIYHVTGRDYSLRLVFGAYDGAQPMPGYRLLGQRTVDGVKLTAFEWTGSDAKPLEGRTSWLAQVGGGRIDDVTHTPWGLRIMADCNDLSGCKSAKALVETIRF